MIESLSWKLENFKQKKENGKGKITICFEIPACDRNLSNSKEGARATQAVAAAAEEDKNSEERSNNGSRGGDRGGGGTEESVTEKIHWKGYDGASVRLNQS